MQVMLILSFYSEHQYYVTVTVVKQQKSKWIRRNGYNTLKQFQYHKFCSDSCLIADAGPGADTIEVYADPWGSLPASFQIDEISGDNIIGFTSVNVESIYDDLFLASISLNTWISYMHKTACKEKGNIY